MAQAILVACIVCFSVGLILSVTLIYRDVKPHRMNEMNEILRADRLWDKALAVVSDLAQVALFVNDITAVTVTITSTSRFNWIYLSITCTLQLIVGTNLARHLRALSIDPFVTYLPYIAIILLTARDVFFYLENPLTQDSSGLLVWNRETKIFFIHESVVISSLAIGPLISVALSYRRLRQHENLEQNSREHKGVLIPFIVTNVIAALCKPCGMSVILYSVRSARPETNIRNGVFLTCISAQLLCAFGFRFRSVTRCITKGIGVRLAIPHLIRTGGDDLQGAVELESRAS